MKVFVTGVGGQLGHDVMNELAKRGHEGDRQRYRAAIQRHGRRHGRLRDALCPTGHHGQGSGRAGAFRSRPGRGDPLCGVDGGGRGGG